MKPMEVLVGPPTAEKPGLMLDHRHRDREGNPNYQDEALILWEDGHLSWQPLFMVRAVTGQKVGVDTSTYGQCPWFDLHGDVRCDMWEGHQGWHGAAGHGRFPHAFRKGL